MDNGLLAMSCNYMQPCVCTFKVSKGKSSRHVDLKVSRIQQAEPFDISTGMYPVGQASLEQDVQGHESALLCEAHGQVFCSISLPGFQQRTDSSFLRLLCEALDTASPSGQQLWS